MSKVILFLAAYLFILALLPCADEGIYMHKAKTLDIHAHETDHNHQHDVCSAMCACSCCGTITHIQDLTVFVFDIKEIYQVLKIPQITHRFQGYRLSVWQPPKFEYLS